MPLAKKVRPGWLDRFRQSCMSTTSPVQTVREADNPRLYGLLVEFERLTDPVLINTSFKVRGEPIVETADEAVSCFVHTGIDALVVHEHLIKKSRWHGVVSPLVKTFDDISLIINRTTSAT